MAYNSPLRPQTKLVIFTFFFSVLALVPTKSEESYAETLSPDPLFLKPPTLTHLSFYLHEVFGKPNATALIVATAPGEAPGTVAFGSVGVIDDVLRTGPEGDSKLIGHAQAHSAVASKTETALTIGINFVFTDGKFNGSTLSVFGRNNLGAKLRELPIVGGSGIFRYARGYVLTSSYSGDAQTGIIIAKYDAYVYHYY